MWDVGSSTVYIYGCYSSNYSLYVFEKGMLALASSNVGSSLLRTLDEGLVASKSSKTTSRGRFQMYASKHTLFNYHWLK